MHKDNNILKEFLDLRPKKDVKEIILGARNKEKIKKLIQTAPEKRFIIYFDPYPVDEIYDGYEFESEEEEFYYYNKDSSLVFQDITNFKVRVKISTIKSIKSSMTFEEIRTAVKIAADYTKKHPHVSKNKLY